MCDESIKLVVVGDGNCGKTCLLISFTAKEFPSVYVPTVFETYTAVVEVDGRRVNLSLWDTAGEEDYDRLRPLSYSSANVVLICFTIDNRDSLLNVEYKWEPEIRHYLPDMPIILVGNKKDLRDSYAAPKPLFRNYKPPVSTEEGKDMAQRLRAVTYLECSAKTRQGVPEVFDAALKAATQVSRPLVFIYYNVSRHSLQESPTRRGVWGANALFRSCLRCPETGNAFRKHGSAGVKQTILQEAFPIPERCLAHDKHHIMQSNRYAYTQMDPEPVAFSDDLVMGAEPCILPLP